MNAAILWTLLIVNFGSNHTTVFGRFDTEKQCQEAAAQMIQRSMQVNSQRGYWVPKLQGVCVPGEMSKGQP